MMPGGKVHSDKLKEMETELELAWNPRNLVGILR
jgi:hypothetical protein